MSEPARHIFLRPSPRKVAMLRALEELNNKGVFPTATKLAKQEDPRITIPSETLASRRRMIRDMRDHGLIETHHDPSSKFVCLRITAMGHYMLPTLESEL